MTLLLLAAIGCAPRAIPPHLQMEPPPAERAPTAAPTTLEAAADQLVQTDPLLRRARPETPEHWAAVPQAGPLVAWAALAAGTTPPPKEWDRVEANFPGTLAVPLVRGAALAVLEAATAGGTLGPDAGVEVLPWLGPVVVDGAALPAAARGPLEWLGGAPEEARGRILHIAERRTLLGWLDGPDLPTAAAAAALRPGVYDRLRDSPTGALLLAHDAPRNDPAQGEAGRASLTRATTLALQAVAADRDIDQVRWRETRERLRDTLGDDPIASSLADARVQLTADAGRPASAGLALVALTAERIHGTCPDRPCRGLDRVATLDAPARWSAEAEAPAAVWRVIAVKAALDSLEVTRDRVGVPSAWLALADALAGSTGGSVRHALLRTRAPDAATWLELSRLAGGVDATTWDQAQAALNAHLLRLVEAALAYELPPAQRDVLTRIRRRLLPTATR